MTSNCKLWSNAAKTMQVCASETTYWSNLVNSVRVLSDPGLSHASVSSLFLCREKERDVWASCLLLGVSSDGFNHSWVPSSFPSITPPPTHTHTHFCTLLFTSYSQYARQLWVTSSFFCPVVLWLYRCFCLYSLVPLAWHCRSSVCLLATQIHFNLSVRLFFKSCPNHQHFVCDLNAFLLCLCVNPLKCLCSWYIPITNHNMHLLASQPLLSDWVKQIWKSHIPIVNMHLC